MAKLADQLQTDYRRTVSDFLELQVRGSLEGPSVLAQLRNALFVHGEAKMEALEAGLITLATSDLRGTLPHVRTPTLVIAGQHDRITAPAASRMLAQAVPDGKYVEMRRAAHAPFLSHRAEFVRVVEEFLRVPEAAALTPAKPAAPVATAKPAVTTPTPATKATPAKKKRRMKARARKKLRAKR